MYSLALTCRADEAELVAAELWDWGTLAISESEWNERVTLLAGFDSPKLRNELLLHFAEFEPEWDQDDTDWEAETRRAWPAREVGQRIFIAAPWDEAATPEGRVRVVSNPGSASGTGEHPCTQLALEALELLSTTSTWVLDVGTGSGILAIAASSLGTAAAFGIDTDWESLATARENFALNEMTASLVAGSAECIADGVADVTVANISGTVILGILHELVRVTKPSGVLVLTGFTENEMAIFLKLDPDATVTACNEWRCLTLSLSRLSSAFV